jgi:hypothetical protein
MKKMISVAFLLALAACGRSEGETHNLSVDEARRASVNAEAYFNQEFPFGVNEAGDLVKKKGTFTACRPQDSNSNNLVTCTGMRPNAQGGYVQATMYCGYNTGPDAIVGCNDKDQK